MHVTKEQKAEVYKMLFNKGVLVAKKDVHCNHHILTKVPNLHVHLLMKSFVSRSFVRETYNWGYHYWFLTDAGVVYLRHVLGLPEDVFPETFQVQKSSAGGFSGERPRPEREERRFGRREGARPRGFGRREEKPAAPAQQ